MYELQWFEMLLLIKHNVFFFIFTGKEARKRELKKVCIVDVYVCLYCCVHDAEIYLDVYLQSVEFISEFQRRHTYCTHHGHLICFVKHVTVILGKLCIRSC